MIAYMKSHESYLQDVIGKHPDRAGLMELIAYHDKQIRWMQHERLAHLITTMFVCLFFLLAFGFTMAHFVISYLILTAVLLVLSAAYLLHYYRLENGIQRWYLLGRDLQQRVSRPTPSQEKSSV